MKAFLRTLIAVLVANLLLIAVVVAIVAMQVREPVELHSGTALIQKIGGEVPEYAPPTAGLPIAEDPETQTTILENLEKARYDKKIRAVVLKLSPAAIGWARLDEIRERIQQLRGAGIPVWAYTEYLTPRSLYIATACDSVFLLPGGYVSLHGFAAERPFIKGTLEKLGIKENLHRIEKYKSAADIIQRKEMSPESRENVNWMLDEVYPSFVRTIEGDRDLEVGQFEREILGSGALVTREALDGRIVDRLAYFDEVESSLLRLKGIEKAKGMKGAPARPRTISGREYRKVSREEAGIRGKKTIAVVHAQGMIQGERSGIAFPFGMTMGAGTMEQALHQAVANEDVKAIVLRVDSGGGESSTSWRINRAVDRAGRHKPLVVSMCDVAASGAYMLAYPCTTLVAGRMSVVGSIGSISGKFNMRGFYEKLGMTKDFVTRGPYPFMESDYYDYTPQEFEAFASRHWMDYQEWVADIARMRNKTPAEIDSVGRGRVFTGSQALAIGLIDEIGTFDTALSIAKKKAGIAEQEMVQLVHYPKKEGLLEALRSGGVSAFLFAIYDSLTEPFKGEKTWAVDWSVY